MNVQREILKFAGLGAMGIALIAVVALVVTGTRSLPAALIAGAVAFVPACISYGVAVWSIAKKSHWQLTGALAGSAIRPLLSLFAGLIVYFAVPFCQTYTFWLWLSAAYLLTLAVEVVLLLKVNRRYQTSAETLKLSYPRTP